MAQLPVEIIDLIFGHLRLDLGEGTADFEVVKALNLRKSATLLNLSLTCRAFQQLALPHMYRIFFCDHKGSVTPLRVLKCFIEQRKPALMIQKLHTEMVGNRSREQHLGGSQGHDYRRSGPSWSLCLLLQSLDIPSSLKQHIYVGLQDGLDDAETAMLLCMCAKLRVWTIRIEDITRLDEGDDIMDDFLDTSLSKVIEAASSPGSRILQQLCEVHVQFEFPDPLQGIMMLPALKRLTVKRSPLNFHHFKPGPPMRTMIEHLYLRDCFLDGPSLLSLLTACTRLTTLLVHRYDLERELLPPEMSYGIPITYPEVGDALRQFGTHLTTFEWKEIDVWMVTSETTFGSLASLTSLQSLTVPLATLVGDVYGTTPDRLDPLLPTSLTTLNVTDVSAKATDPLLSLPIGIQLAQLMTDQRYARLSTISIAFSRLEHFADITGWRASGSPTESTPLTRDVEYIVLERT